MSSTVGMGHQKAGRANHLAQYIHLHAHIEGHVYMYHFEHWFDIWTVTYDSESTCTWFYDCSSVRNVSRPVSGYHVDILRHSTSHLCKYSLYLRGIVH